VENDAGEILNVTRDVIQPVTIADLIFAAMIAVVTLISAQNLPGLLEISVLQKLPLENSIRYLIKTLCSYVILLLGLVVSFGVIGVHWNQVQWMATALTFGLAFGLQEMFANFVAGIIILFERPIRVGDIVTLDEISGTVSRVRIRATTITNWDRKDFIVPNKDFITGRVLNWTLTDQVNRIVINVGVAYGSDTALAKQLLVKIAKEHPLIVDDPPPQATFEEFGDSSLLIVTRCFISMRDISSRIKVIDELHSIIDTKFRQAEIEIAFPQRDLHIRSFSPPVSVESRNGSLPQEAASPAKK
jgi:potassium efflux system protein